MALVPQWLADADGAEVDHAGAGRRLQLPIYARGKCPAERADRAKTQELLPPRAKSRWVLIDIISTVRTATVFFQPRHPSPEADKQIKRCAGLFSFQHKRGGGS